MRVFTPQFETGWASSYPSQATAYESLAAAVEHYRKFVQECDTYGYGEPIPVFVYRGAPSGDETDYGYPDYPDYVMEPYTDRYGTPSVKTVRT